MLWQCPNIVQVVAANSFSFVINSINKRTTVAIKWFLWFSSLPDFHIHTERSTIKWNTGFFRCCTILTYYRLMLSLLLIVPNVTLNKITIYKFHLLVIRRKSRFKINGGILIFFPVNFIDKCSNVLVYLFLFARVVFAPQWSKSDC